MSVALGLASGFVECLLLVLTVVAYRSGRRLYGGAIAGMALLLYSRVADGFIADSTRLWTAVAGLVLGGLVVLGDLLFEAVPKGGSEAEPPV